ncbi:hypothetical protein VP1G_01040 [Cytospora mali]|uniref:Transcriptional regulator WAR1 n=1 Tax=Cytospora mali TaxID=578113 RepID=A0A194UPR6_CYTMA|nr:hypothetical protein VP1G_01040 [Valsa mali var. pyri (nom. inval.)]
MEERNSSQTAPYGQACMHCFKSKCKCVRRLDGDGCERKECVPASRRRRHVEQKDSAEKIVELEGKLDRLVGLLESVARSPGVSASLRKALNDDDEELEDPRARSVSSEQEQEQHPQNVEPATVSSSSSGAVFTESVSTAAATPLTSTSGHDLLCEARPSPGVSCSCATRPHSCDSSPHDAEICLQMFRSRFLPFFPFIYLAPNISAQILLMTRPVLMRAIMAVATPSTQQKLARGAELKRVLAHATLLENQSNIDLLLGLLVFIAWSNDQFLNKVGNRKMGSLSRPMMLAISIVSELQWNRPAAQSNHMAASLPMQSAFPVGDEQRGGDQDSLEIQRAVLGCFMLSSFISSYFGQTEPLQFTPHMEGYLQNLEQNSDISTDKMLAGQIRLQLLAQSVAQAQTQHGEHNTESLNGPESFYFNTVQVQLQALQTSLDPVLLQEEILTAHIHYVELTILEAFYPIPNSPEAAPGLKRARFAWKSLQAVKSFFEVFFARSSRSPASCAGISFTFWAQVSKSLVVLFRLSTMSDWNENEVDLMIVLNRLVETMDHASLEAGEQSPDDLYCQFAQLLRTFQRRVGGKMGSGSGTHQATWVGPAPHGSDTMLNDSLDVTMIQGVDFENEEWFQDFFSRM